MLPWLLIAISTTSGPAQEPGDRSSQPPSIQIELKGSVGPLNAAHSDVIKNVKRIDDGRALTCSADGSIGLWDLNEGQLIRRFVDERAKTIFCVAITSDFRHVIGGGDGNRIVAWDFESGEVVQQWPAGGRVYCVDVFPDNQTFVAGDASGQITYGHVGKPDPLEEFRVDNEDITAIRCLPDGSGFVSGNGDGEIQIWNLDQPKPLRKYSGLSGWTCCIQVSDDLTSLVASDYSGNVAMWDQNTGKKIWSQSKVSGKICWLRMADKKIIAVDGADGVFEMEVDSGKHRKRKIDMPSISGFDFSSDRQTMFCGGKNLLCGWSVTDGELRFPSDRTYRDAGPVKSMTVSGNYLFRVGSGPTLIGNDLKRQSECLELDLTEVFGSAVTGKNIQLFVLGGELVIAGPNSAASVSLGELDAEPAIAKSEFAAISKSPTGSSLIGLNRKRNQLVEFHPIGPRKDRELTNATDSVKNIRPVGDRFFSMQVEKEISVHSFDTGQQLGTTTLAFEPQQIAAAERLLLATDGNQLVGFHAPGLPETPPLTDAEVAELVENLSAGNYQSREQAMTRLAGSGDRVLEQIEQLKVDNAEAKFRVKQIRSLIAGRGLPDLNRPLTANVDGPFDAIAVDPVGEFWVVAVAQSWRSVLKWGVIEAGRFKEFESPLTLRGRVSQIVFDAGGKQLFVGYADGSIQQFAIHRQR